MSFGDLKLHGHSNIFFPFGVNRRGPGTEFNNQSHTSQGLGMTSMVHGVNNSLRGD